MPVIHPSSPRLVNSINLRVAWLWLALLLYFLFCCFKYLNPMTYLVVDSILFFIYNLLFYGCSPSFAFTINYKNLYTCILYWTREVCTLLCLWQYKKCLSCRIEFQTFEKPYVLSDRWFSSLPNVVSTAFGELVVTYKYEYFMNLECFLKFSKATPVVQTLWHCS